jgi:hypothetical protein
MSERSRNGSYAVAISNRAAYERSRELRARIVPVVGAGLAIEAGAPSTEALKTALARAAGACRIMGVSLLRKPPTYESTLTRSSGCGQRGVCRCLTRPTLGPRSATACKRGHLAIRTERSRNGRLEPVQGRSVRRWVRPPAPAVAIGPISAVGWSRFPHRPVPPAVAGWGH